ncbi:amidohydrolase family protein [Legionella oakridgensis]|uniref:5-carboxyvanillate decarboxylase n=2 Tax=Legionella oakridgensis TaxID=29423 RepID=A0A0W0WXZ0_9GAMM|nr:amidohydrolase family protein [Legionella oakridgensis]AHE67043.1 putative metal-dependent hydrolase of the TIM-barrel fold protein [Legionella oakridgensis ATCC 33761 = DSM 21215]ETO93328.1 putative metal-dependent hydrolase [Legionella oakridgensis RV-2-2007]KTD37193.1 5-carboxyvanillate decarboxylase [Legionella oakridgensis]STY20137.1 5-carboxyvanillate decarboxylase [Legionella longbeachae]
MTAIDLEAHFYTKAIFEYLRKQDTFPRLVKEKEPDSYNLWFTKQIALFQSTAFINQLCDLGESRINAMDKAGIDIQVLSFSSPGIDEFDADHKFSGSAAIELNDLLYETIKQHPTRFLGFATISPYDVSQGVRELERAITKLKFVGWLAHSNFGENNYFDDKKYWPLLEAAESLNIPIYLHPTTPLTKEFGQYGFALAGPPLGFQTDVALCALRMIYAGVFDAFPKLKIILGHMGEMLPFLMPDRIDWAYSNPQISKLPGFIKQRPDIKRIPSQVILENFYVTTSGRFSKELLDYTLKIMGEHRVMLATDYPYENANQSMDFLKTSGLSDSLYQKICSKNAEKLGIKLPSQSSAYS